MATISLYNHTRKLFANGEVTLADLKVMLLNTPAAFVATHTVVGNVSANQVSGGGWAVGGQSIAAAAITVVATSHAMLDGTDISVAATGANIGPATAAVIYDDDTTTKNLLFYIDFEGSVTATNGVDNFEILWNASGIHRWTA